MRYLFVGAHTDEELCFGGFMTKLIEQKNEVMYYVFSCGSSNSTEFENSNSILNNGDWVMGNNTEQQEIADIIYNDRDSYDYIVTHSIKDRHPMHRMIAEEVHRVYNGNLLTFIGPWNGNEEPNYFVEISQEQLERKVAAMACYKSQRHRPYMDPEFIRSWARYNGIKCGKLYAEGFKIVRLVQ